MKVRNCLVVLITLVSVLGSYAPVKAATTWDVCKTGCTYSTIGSAVAIAVSGDTVDVTDNGVYSENIAFDGKDITIVSTSAVNATINGTGSGSVFSITNVTSSNAVLDGFLIINGSATYGGGVYAVSSNVSITNCQIFSNEASTAGGAIYGGSSDVTITNSVITSNMATSTGGGIHSASSDVIITDSDITSNRATSSTGGGIYSSSSSLMVADCIISHNNGTGAGGVYLTSNTSTSFERSVISNNSSGNGTGGGLNIQTPATLTNCLITKNNANGAGGIYFGGNADNSSLVNCTVADNKDSNYGGIRVYPGATGVEILNSIIWGNTSTSVPDQITGTVGVTYSNVEQDSGVYPGTGNINSDPFFVNRYDDDYQLDCDSPAKDAGTSSGAPSDDLNSYTRPYVGTDVDMGAYEYQGSGECAAATTHSVCFSESECDFTTIQSAIDSSSVKNGDTIEVDSGTYGALDFNGKSLTIVSTTCNATIDGNNNGSAVTISYGDSRTVLDCFTVTNGDAAIGGGGINISNSAPSITNCVITNNTATNYGGGISAGRSNYSLTNCDVTFNLTEAVGSDGGGIYNSASKMTYIDNIITNNYTDLSNGSYGGGLFITSSPFVAVSDCIIYSNKSFSAGGIYLIFNGSTSFERSVISNNKAVSGGTGGGINIKNPATLTNCLITKNNADSAGGIYFGTGADNSSLVNCTVADNRDSNYGGIRVYPGATGVEILNSIIWGNTSTSVPDQITGTAGVTYSNVEQDSGVYSGTGNINSDPFFVNRYDDDYQLDCDSPAKDAGTSSGAPSDDLNSYTRPYVGTDVDMGAYEYQGSGECAASTTHSVCFSESECDFTTIQSALDSSSVKNGDTVEVLDSRDYNAIDFKGKSVNLNTKYFASIDAGGSGSAVTIEYTDSRMVLDGFYITNGDAATSGGGISITYSTPSITNCVITNNTATNYGGGISAGRSNYSLTNCDVTFNLTEAVGSDGGGIYNSASKMTYIKNTITNNYTGLVNGSYGGGMCITSSPLVAVSECIIYSNKSFSAGGVYLIFNGSTSFERSVISKNKAVSGGTGGGINIKNPATLTNCLITKNNANSAGGIYFGTDADNSSLVNCTVADNNDSTAGGVYIYSGATGVEILNSILWSNTDSSGLKQITNNGSLNVSYSDVQQDSGVYSGDGNINDNPDFVDSLSGDYHLQALATPTDCIDKGTASGAPYIDLDGTIRPIDGVSGTQSADGYEYDMGVYEYSLISSNLGIISGYVMNLSDSPLSSVTVNLKEYQSQGELISATTSNSDGYYKFENLPNHIYIIEAEDGTLLNRKTGKTNKSLPWAKEEYINLYLDK